MIRINAKLLISTAAFVIAGALTQFVSPFGAEAQTRKTEVWDFGGVAESGSRYHNNISVNDITAVSSLSAGKYAAGDIQYGTLLLNVGNNDRAYYEGPKNYGVQGYTKNVFEDGYESNGVYYCNGKGSDTQRYFILSDVQAGDLISVYSKTSNSSDETLHFALAGEDRMPVANAQNDTAKIGDDPVRRDFIAKKSGKYKIYTENKAGKPVYYRVVQTPCVNVSGALAALPKGNSSLKFTAEGTDVELPGLISGGSYTAKLTPGYNWTAVLSGIPKYGITADTMLVKIDEGDAGSKMTKNLAVGEQKTFEAAGSIAGFDSSYSISKMEISFVPPAKSHLQTAKAAVKGNDFTVFLEPNIDYVVKLGGVPDYYLKGNGTSAKPINGDKGLKIPLEVAKKPVYTVKGNISGADKETMGFVKAPVFKNMDDGAEYTGTLNGTSYQVSLRDGSYTVDCTALKYASGNHIIVKGSDVTKDIHLFTTEAVTEKAKLVKDLYVSKTGRGYKTIQEAVNAAALMAPESEADRITIHVAPGVYREQVILSTPYISLVNDNPDKEVLVTWYYGIGFKYYSATVDGYYDAERAYDKFDKNAAAKWGVAFYVKESAVAFRASDITFESSFNRYITQEELADGVETDGSKPARKLNSDVTSRTNTERASAFACEADKAELVNCAFYSSQDTLYTSGGKGEIPCRQYYKNCIISGNTDFIFGSGDVVFENCEIQWAGYSDTKQYGYLTAARGPANHGYLFYNCVVSANPSLMTTPGYFGRPWEQKAGVAFINTMLATDDLIANEGWTSMSGNVPEKANFKEYNTFFAEPVSTNGRVAGTVLSDAKNYTPAVYFGDWTPSCSSLTKKQMSANAKLKGKVSLTSNDDLNTPYAGHTLTLHYSMGKDADPIDVSVIKWYAVKDGVETLVKQSRGFADKTYAITTADAGSQIKAVVELALANGKTAAPVSVMTDATVREGVAVVAAAKGGIRAENKVNVFLAGDSTVKDYSAAGMYNGGIARDEGSWGEYLQNFFNDSVAIQNYANGGRSTRNFINEGTLDKIAAQIGKGDYLFIQFGHNDCSNSSGYLEDRYVPLGKPDASGVYPAKAGKKVATPASLKSKYGDEFYSYDCGATQKWYLKQYIDVARKAGATPVLVTPVSRMYYTENGTIRPHHDSTDTTTKTLTTENNAYVEVVRQLAAEEKVLLIDGFEMTKALYEKAYKDNGGDKEARVLMCKGESTHNGKIGGFVLSMLFANEISSKIPALGKAKVAPNAVLGEQNDGTSAFSVGLDGKFSCGDAYWDNYVNSALKSKK